MSRGSPGLSSETVQTASAGQGGPELECLGCCWGGPAIGISWSKKWLRCRLKPVCLDCFRSIHAAQGSCLCFCPCSVKWVDQLTLSEEASCKCNPHLFQTDVVNTMCGYKTIDKEVMPEMLFPGNVALLSHPQGDWRACRTWCSWLLEILHSPGSEVELESQCFLIPPRHRRAWGPRICSPLPQAGKGRMLGCA